MDDVKRKVLLDLFASPGTVLPIAGGLTMLLASWATGGSPTLTFGGIAGVLGGLGVLASRLILGLEGMTKRAYDLVVGKQRAEQEAALEELDRNLCNDDDPRTQQCLRDLRMLYDGLQKKVKDGDVTPAAYEILEGVDKLFKMCVHQLEHSHELYEAAGELSGTAKESLLKQRDEVVSEVAMSVDHLGKNVENFHLVKTRNNRSELARLRAELDESIDVAKRVEERTESLGKSVKYDASEFE